MAITTFLFDLGGVLFSNGTKQFISYLAKRYNLTEVRVAEIIDGDIGSKYREAKISRNEFWELVQKGLPLEQSSDELETIWIESYQIISGTKEIISTLAKKYGVYYLSDNVGERVRKLDEKFDFLKLFKGGIFSHEVGVRKPHPQVYKYALAKTGSEAQDTVFIDDKESALVPAAEMGIQTVLFVTPELLRTSLLQRGISL